MPDPRDSLNSYLMFFTAQETTFYANEPEHYFYQVRLARSTPGDVLSWSHAGFYPSTDYAHTRARRLESPHVFPDGAHVLWSQDDEAVWRIMYTDGAWVDSARAVLFSTKKVGPPLVGDAHATV